MYFWEYFRIINLKNKDKTFFDSIIMLRFGKTTLAKEKFHGAKKR